MSGAVQAEACWEVASGLLAGSFSGWPGTGWISGWTSQLVSGAVKAGARVNAYYLCDVPAQGACPGARVVNLHDASQPLPAHDLQMMIAMIVLDGDCHIHSPLAHVLHEHMHACLRHRQFTHVL